MKLIFLIISVVFTASNSYSQEWFTGGNLDLGLRNTASLFTSEHAKFGAGVGGQARLQISERVNTEWFADLIKADLDNAGVRIDGHIGWSVLFYPFNPTARLKPYLLGGHCFDYTKVQAYSYTSESNADIMGERWSSAVQMGLGTHYYLTDRFDISFTAQYMMHLGNDIHAHLEEVNGINRMEITSDKGAGLEGHILLNLNMNYKIADLW